MKRHLIGKTALWKNVQNNALIIDVVTLKQGHLYVLVLCKENHVIYTNVNQKKVYTILKINFIKVLYVRIRCLTWMLRT